MPCSESDGEAATAGLNCSEPCRRWQHFGVLSLSPFHGVSRRWLQGVHAAWLCGGRAEDCIGRRLSVHILIWGEPFIRKLQIKAMVGSEMLSVTSGKRSHIPNSATLTIKWSNQLQADISHRSEGSEDQQKQIRGNPGPILKTSAKLCGSKPNLYTERKNHAHMHASFPFLLFAYQWVFRVTRPWLSLSLCVFLFSQHYTLEQLLK